MPGKHQVTEIATMGCRARLEWGHGEEGRLLRPHRLTFTGYYRDLWKCRPIAATALPEGTKHSLEDGMQALSPESGCEFGEIPAE